MTAAAEAKSWREQLRHVLNTVWDPIGGCPPDEYDRYRDDLEIMIRKGGSDEVIKRYLAWAVTENMDMIVDPAALRTGSNETIAAIRALGPVP